MEETRVEEECLIKVYACWGEEKPMQIYQLSAKAGEEYRNLLKRLEVLAEILPYITKAEEDAKKLQKTFEYSTTIENLKMAITLGMVDKKVAVNYVLQPH